MDKQELKKHICACFLPFQPRKILLFGSWARNQHDRYSDIDLIIVYETRKRFLDRLEELYLCWNLPMAIDILAYTPDEFELLRHDNPFIQEACQEGEVIYEHAAQGSKTVAGPS